MDASPKHSVEDATLFLMCGLAFSGKTTMACAIADALACDYVGLDEINAERGLWGGTGIPVEEWERTHQIALAEVGRLLSDGRCVVLDDTNNLRWLRDRFRELARQQGAAVCVVYMDVPLDEIRRRIERSRVQQDRRLVRDDVLSELAKSFEAPGPDEEPIVCGVEDRPDVVIERLRLRRRYFGEDAQS